MSKISDMAGALSWRSATMAEAIQHSQARDLINPDNPSAFMSIEGIPEFAGVVLFADGTGIACVSRWKGPYSEVTPDIDGEPPDWFIGTPKDGGK